MKNTLQTDKQRVRMDYLYRKEEKTKWVALEQVVHDVKNGKYERLVKAARGLGAAVTSDGMVALPGGCP